MDEGSSFRTNGDPQDPAFIGQGLAVFPDSIPARSIALEQNGADSAARVVYVGLNQVLYKSRDSGATFKATPYSFSAWITAIATTTADSDHVWVGADDGTVHFSPDAGANWDSTPGFNTIPVQGGVATAVAVDPANPHRVAVAYTGQFGIDATYRTMHLYLTTDAGRTWNDIGGNDGAGPAGNLPDLPLHSVVFDTGVSPSAIIVAGDAGVMRWVTPPVLRVGTYGRGCFEITRHGGPAISVESSLGFGFAPQGRSCAQTLYVYNSGSAPLAISSISRAAGSTDFTIGAFTFPTAIPPGGTVAVAVVFAPSSLGDLGAAFEIASNDPDSPYTLAV